MKGPVVHGTRSCYNHGCRLPECREANSAYMNGYMCDWRSFRATRARIDALVGEPVS